MTSKEEVQSLMTEPSARLNITPVLAVIRHRFVRLAAKDGQPELVIPKISQETLADMIGTTRSRVSFFLNRFKKLGFIEYNGGLQVHSSLLNIILHD